MYQAHFELKYLPFSATATPENTYQSPELKEALSHFAYAIENHDPILLLTGEVGSGKTTAIQVALRQFRQDMSVAVVSHGTLTPRELLEAVVIQYNLQTERRETKPQMIRRLETHFLRCRDAGRPPLLIFDEAHLLKPSVMEELRLLSNLNRRGENLTQIFLVGQRELEKRLQKGNRSLRQRISVRYRLKPLSREETGHYIAHRLRAAGCSKPAEIFSPEAVAAVYRLSGGLPREINVIAGYSMLTCFVSSQYRVTIEHVRSVMAEYGFQGVTEVPEEDIAPAKAPKPERLAAEAPESPNDAPRVTEEEPLTVQPQESGAADPGPALFAATPSGTHGSIPKLGANKKAVVVMVVVAAIVAFGSWALWDSGPRTTDGRGDEQALASAEPETATASRASPAAEPALSRDAVGRDTPVSEVNSEEVVNEDIAEEIAPLYEPSRPARGDDLPVIKRDNDLATAPDQTVTVQIAALLDPEAAEQSLSRLSEGTDIPGAVEVVNGGETTWYLVLLGCYNDAEEAEAAIRPVLPILGRQAVTEVRIKPAPSWLQSRLSEQMARQ